MALFEPLFFYLAESRGLSFTYCAEAEIPEDEGEIGGRRALRDVRNEPQQEDGPQVEVFCRIPQTTRGDGLAVVHIACNALAM